MLFWREVKKIVVSIPWLLFVAAVAIGLYSQGVFRFGEERLEKPQPGESYGVKAAEIPEQIMPAALDALWAEFCENDYVTYPIGFIRHVKLDEKEQAQMAKILSEITGIETDVLLAGRTDRAQDSSGQMTMEIGGNIQMEEDGEGGYFISPAEGQPQGKPGEIHPAVRVDMDYARFQDLMRQADDLLGGGSSYEEASLSGFSSLPLTFEEALARYELAVYSDRITGGYARLFCDYAGVMTLSLLPVFLAVILCMKDRQAQMEELIYTRRISSLRIVAVRYLALLTAAMLPVIALSYLSNIPVWGLYEGIRLDYLAPLVYDLGWLLPSVMITTAIGMFLTELTGTPAAVAVQGLWWLVDLNQGFKTVLAGYALFRLAPRHNAGSLTWFRTGDFQEHFADLAKNRLLFAGLSLLLIALTVPVYETKRRRGKVDGKGFFQRALSGMGSRKNQCEA